jgi:hypothetical protein
LSPKTVATDFADLMKRNWLPWCLFVVWAGCVPGVCRAQGPAAMPPEAQKQEEPQKFVGLEEPSTEKLAPAPIPITEETASLGLQTFVGDVVKSRKNHWGFSLSAYQGYSTDVSRTDGQSRQSSSILAFSPRTFFNFGKRKSQLHLDLGTGYRHYYGNNQLDGWDYDGNAQYSYKPSKRSSIQVSDQLTYSNNDSWSFISLNAPLEYKYNFSNEIIFNQQRITRNSLQARLSYQAGRRAELGIYGGYNLYRYTQSTLSSANSFETGASFNFRICKWLHLANSYSVYFGDERFRSSRIHNLQLGGLDFHLGRSWRIWGGLGANFANQNKDFSFTPGAGINAGINYISRRTQFSLTCQRGLTSLIGLSGQLNSDVFTASYGYRMSHRMTASLQSYYYRNSELGSNGRLETLSGGGGLQFALQRNLSASVNGFYQDQRSHDFSIQGLGLSRFSAYAGLQYVWPSRRRADY